MSTSPTPIVLLAATVLCLLSACAGDASPGSGDAGAPRPATPGPATADPSAPPTAAPSSSAAPPEDLVVPPSGRGSVLTGSVEAGVEPGCLLLRASGDLHQLVGAVQGLAPGQRVTVQGRSDPTVTTTCQQGTPFVVTSSRPA